MNDNHLPDDDVLQLVFGELDAERQAAVRKAVAEDAELAATARGLEAAVAGRARRERGPGQRRVQRPTAAADVGGFRSRAGRDSSSRRFLSRSLDTWRWIMRSPVSRVAAAAILVVAITGVALWFHGGGATPALADFLEPIIEAKNAKYKITTVMKGPHAGTATSQVMELDASRSRLEMEVEVEVGTPKKHKLKTVQVWDGRQAKNLHLDPAQKQARVYSYSKLPKDTDPSGGPMAGFREILLNARDLPELKRESLGEKEIDGRRVIGFRVSKSGMEMNVWGDPKTGLPVRIEASGAMIPNTEFAMSDFEFNVEMDESLFSVEPPAGYEVIEIENSTSDGSLPEEKELIGMFRCYIELSGGLFPDKLDRESVVNSAMTLEWTSANIEHPPKAQRAQEWADAQSTLQGGLQFALGLPPEADWHYAGRGVSLGESETPVFWYRPKETTTYRVVYGDLSVREAQTPPSVPVTKPGRPERDLIDMFRCSSELSNGRFPNSLEAVSLVHALAFASHSLENPDDPSARRDQRRRIAEAHLRLQRGLKFASLLPKEADSHYAGKGVSLGAAETPIFWYRPKEGEKYRVVYADLSVHDGEAPPSVREVLPEQDLINTLRSYSELSGGPFPDLLKAESLLMMVMTKKCSFESLEQMQKPNAKQIQEISRYYTQFQPGLNFAASLTAEADPHYAGKGISLGAAETPIFWYRPNDSKKYRVIFADLSVGDTDTAPSVPDVLPEQDLIDMFRYWSELSGGPFPDADSMSMDEDAGEVRNRILEKKFGLEKGEKPDAKQLPEYIETVLKLLPGSTFVGSLPADADAHYAGTGVSFGAAETPIFWYRPKDATKYRVIYADLSVRDADTAPSVADAERVAVPSSPKE